MNFDSSVGFRQAPHYFGFCDAILPRGGRVWLGSLIRLLEPLELNERLVRTSVFVWSKMSGCARRVMAAF